MNDLKKSVEVVGEPWKESAYYDDAERWTWLFWNDGTLFRRLFDQLDTKATLELACGYGRHAEKTAPLSHRLVLMDIFQKNIDISRKRLMAYPNVEYYLNNGFDFRPVEDASLTAIYCYDAMVHFSPDIIASYLKDASRVLAQGGMALFHHSNRAEQTNRHYGQNPHARNDMTKDRFAQLANNAGLSVVEQIVMPWADVSDLDCLSLVRKP